jgi:hypothetical protein
MALFLQFTWVLKNSLPTKIIEPMVLEDHLPVE